MAEGRSRALWVHTSQILAWMGNIHRDPRKGEAFQPGDFDPHARADRAHAETSGAKFKLRDVKDLLLGMRPKPGGSGA